MASAMVEAPHSAHSKLHKRHPPDTGRLPRRSPTISPSPVIGRPSLDFKRKFTYDEQSASPSSSSLKIKPYVRKPSAKDSGHVDLSRSMAENETLVGLGLGLGDSGFTSTYTLGTRSASDVSFTPVRGPRHRRSTSGNSHISTASNGLRQQPSTYVHPLRQTPRPYTPPISMSDTAAAGGEDSGDDVVEEIPRPANEADALRRLTSNTSSEHFGRRGSESLSNFPSLDGPHFLQPQTSDPSGRLESPSPSSVGGRSRGETLQSIDTLNPSSRPSLDKAFHFIRSQRSNVTTTTDPDPAIDNPDASRAASIRAARQAYQEREQAKDRKAEKEEMRLAEREMKKQHKRDERRRRRSVTTNPPDPTHAAAAAAAATASPPMDEKRDLCATHYASLKPDAEPERTEQSDPGKDGPSSRRDAVAKNIINNNNNKRKKKKKKKNQRGAQPAWSIFLAWFRTRLLRMGG